MADLVERLRIVARTTVHVRFDAAEPFVADIIVEAADRIAALEAEASEGERRGVEPVAYQQREHVLGNWSLWYPSTKAAYDQIRAFPSAYEGLFEVRALIPEAPVREGWRPISTAPKDWSDVLLFVPDLQSDHRTVCEGFYDAEEKIWRSPAFWEIGPTHWRPLPAPPQDNREG